MSSQLPFVPLEWQTRLFLPECCSRLSLLKSVELLFRRARLQNNEVQNRWDWARQGKIFGGLGSCFSQLTTSPLPCIITRSPSTSVHISLSWLFFKVELFDALVLHACETGPPASSTEQQQSIAESCDVLPSVNLLCQWMAGSSPNIWNGDILKRTK